MVALFPMISGSEDVELAKIVVSNGRKSEPKWNYHNSLVNLSGDATSYEYQFEKYTNYPKIVILAKNRNFKYFRFSKCTSIWLPTEAAFSS